VQQETTPASLEAATGALGLAKQVWRAGAHAEQSVRHS